MFLPLLHAFLGFCVFIFVLFGLVVVVVHTMPLLYPDLLHREGGNLKLLSLSLLPACILPSVCSFLLLISVSLLLLPLQTPLALSLRHSIKHRAVSSLQPPGSGMPHLSLWQSSFSSSHPNPHYYSCACPYAFSAFLPPFSFHLCCMCLRPFCAFLKRRRHCMHALPLLQAEELCAMPTMMSTFWTDLQCWASTSSPLCHLSLSLLSPCACPPT